jgi:hypothetical protein
MGTDKDKDNERQRRLYQEDPEFRKRKRLKNRSYWAANKKELCRRRRHRWKTDPEFRMKQRLSRDGFSISDYDKLFAQQKGGCGICRRRDRPLTIDHCHETGLVRGLLCTWCNCGLGFYQDKPRLTRAAAAYLEAWKKSRKRQGKKKIKPSRSAKRAARSVGADQFGRRSAPGRIRKPPGPSRGKTRVRYGAWAASSCGWGSDTRHGLGQHH